MKHSIKTGLSFGLTSSIITTLGLIIGLYFGTGSEITVIGGIITIAVADALSDALGIHISEESEGKHTKKEIWESTFTTFLAKFFFTLTFLVPILLFNSVFKVIASIIWGIIILGILSFFISKNQKTNSLEVILEHTVIAFAVIIITFFIGKFILFLQ